MRAVRRFKRTLSQTVALSDRLGCEAFPQHDPDGPEAERLAPFRPTWLRRRSPGEGVEVEPGRCRRDKLLQEQRGGDRTCKPTIGGVVKIGYVGFKHLVVT